MNIFIKIKNSIYNPKYYSEIIEKPFSYSLKYFVLFALIFALAFTIVATIKFIPISKFLSGEISKASDYFPQNLEINIKNGKVSTNAPEPFFVKLPQGFENNIENAVVIDTKNKFDMAAFNSYKTFALITSDSAVYLNNNNQITITSLANVKDFTLNREKVANLINKIKPLLVFLYPLVFIGAYIAGFIFVLATLVYLLLGALLVWLIVKAKGLKIGYGKSFQLGMHLMTFAIMITSVLNVISSKLTIPFLFTILLVLSAFLNIQKNALDTLNKKE